MLTQPGPVEISSKVGQNLRRMRIRRESLEQRIEKIKAEITTLGDLRPGALSLQYNICGNPKCRCKATPPIKHGPYPQVSFTWRGKSTTQFVRKEDVTEVRQQLQNYRRLRNLVERWVTLSMQLSRLRLDERREQRSRSGKSVPKSRISKENTG